MQWENGKQFIHLLEVWPAQISARVESCGGKFLWAVAVVNFKHERLAESGESRELSSACLAAEACADKWVNVLWKPWMKEALEAGWRPPS